MSRSPRFFSILLAAGISLALAFPLGVVPTASAGDTASISGTVTARGGAALPGVEVTVYRFGNESWAPVSSTLTDRAGRYRLTGLPAWPAYRLGFMDPAGKYVGEPVDSARVRTGADIALVGGATVSGKNAELALAGRIRGTVTDADGAALDGVYVAAFQRLPGVAQWTEVTATMTDRKGRYNLGGLAAGTCRIWFTVDAQEDEYVPEYYGNAETVMTAKDVSVTPAATTSVKDARLAKGGHITGTVTGTAGAALAGIAVTAYQWDGSHRDWEHVVWASTGADGGYDLSRLPDGSNLRAGTYRLGFEDHTGAGYADEFYGNVLAIEEATDISVTVGATTPGKNAQLAWSATSPPPTSPIPEPGITSLALITAVSPLAVITAISAISAISATRDLQHPADQGRKGQ